MLSAVAFRPAGLLSPSTNYNRLPYNHLSPVISFRTTSRAMLVCLAALATSQISAQTVSKSATPTAKPATPATTQPEAAKPHAPRKPRTYQASFNPALVLLDPAHGNQDNGATIAKDLPEKELNLAFARRLRDLLAARGFTVQFTRENDVPPPRPAPVPDPNDPNPPPPPPPPPAPITLDQRAEQANRTHPVACILIHHTTTGHGVHLFTSALTPANPSAELHQVLLWDAAQTPSLPNSTTLSGRIAETITAQSLPLISARVSVKPIDSMTCPAVVIELAPLVDKAGKTTPVQDENYQLRVATAVAEGVLHWRSDAEAILQTESIAAERAAAAAAESTDKSKPKPKAKPAPNPNVVTPGHLIPGVIPPLPKIPQIVAPTMKRPAATTPPPPGGAK